MENISKIYHLPFSGLLEPHSLEVGVRLQGKENLVLIVMLYTSRNSHGQKHPKHDCIDDKYINFMVTLISDVMAPYAHGHALFIAFWNFTVGIEIWFHRKRAMKKKMVTVVMKMKFWQEWVKRGKW